MFRKSKRQDADEVRAKFLANREKVRSWLVDWNFPEVEWEEFSEVPLPWIVPRGGEQRWLEKQALFMDDYRWFLQARSRAEGVTSAHALWEFGGDHEFQRLEIQLQTFADPAYVAETLAWGAHAAALKGWQENDVQELYTWLFEGIDSRPLVEMVSGKQRTGFILFDLLRSPTNDNEIVSRLRMTLTDKSLDGSPLNEEGRD
ncbi:hypothetical protein OHR68_34380 [Spirillospora sp. NBC_00431]